MEKTSEIFCCTPYSRISSGGCQDYRIAATINCKCCHNFRKR